MLLDENTGILVTKNGIIKLNRNEIMFFIYLIYSKKNIYSYKEFIIWIYGIDDNDCKLFYMDTLASGIVEQEFLVQLHNVHPFIGS